MIKSIKINKSRSKFSELIREDGDSELNEILVKYNFTLNKLMKLDDAMNDANVKLSNSRGRSLFNKYREYKDLREMHLELVKLRKKRKNNKRKISYKSNAIFCKGQMCKFKGKN